MKQRYAVAFLIVSFFLALPCYGQSWSGILAPTRAFDWSTAGAGPIPNRTTICQTLSSGATASQINTVIANCPSGQVVFLNAGTYNLGSPGILINGKSNVTLRGAGADQTILVFRAVSACGGPEATICVKATGQPDPDSPPHTANWTAGYGQGATSVTLSSTTGLAVGMLLILDQLNDSGADTGNIWMRLIPSQTCIQCFSPSRSGRSQSQVVTVTSINGSIVGISPGLAMPNWRSGQTPGAWWGNSQPVSGVGIENLTIDGSGILGQNNVLFYYATLSWVKGVRSVTPQQHHIRFFVSAKQTIRDNYFYGTQAAESESYGINTFISASDLVENNIFQRIAVPMMNESSVGSVYAYNFSVYDLYGDHTWAQASSYQHAPNNVYILWEGNHGFGIDEDNVHGPAYFITAFRNRWEGFETGNELQTVAVHIYSFNRYTNVIGNVLGTSTYHTTYASQAGGSSANCTFSIYALGYGSNCDPGGSPPFPLDDTLVATTLMRWGNYDTVNAGNRFVSGEVPSGISPYANSVPASQTLPASFYLAAKPNWFPVAKAWPPIGPDVTGGNIANVGGHAYSIPAKDCYTTTMGGPADGTGPVLTFNAAACYPSQQQGPPSPPTNLRVVP